MKKGIWFSLLILMLLLSGCNQEDDMDKKEIKNTASNVAVEFLKVKEDIDFVVNDVRFLDGVGVTLVSVDGHVKGNKEKEMSVTIDYANDYEVQGVGED